MSRISHGELKTSIDAYAEGSLKLSEAIRSFEALKSGALAVEKQRSGETKRLRQGIIIE